MSATQATTIRSMQARKLLASWLAEARQWGPGDAYLGKRRHPRYRWRAAVELEVETLSGKTIRMNALTRDISEGGIGLETRQAIEAHSVVRVRMMGHSPWVEGTVVHSGECMGLHIVGVEFTPFEDPGGPVPPRFPRSASTCDPRAA